MADLTEDFHGRTKPDRTAISDLVFNTMQDWKEQYLNGELASLRRDISRLTSLQQQAEQEMRELRSELRTLRTEMSDHIFRTR